MKLLATDYLYLLVLPVRGERVYDPHIRLRLENTYPPGTMNASQQGDNTDQVGALVVGH